MSHHAERISLSVVRGVNRAIRSHLLTWQPCLHVSRAREQGIKLWTPPQDLLAGRWQRLEWRHARLRWPLSYAFGNTEEKARELVHEPGSRFTS